MIPLLLSVFVLMMNGGQADETEPSIPGLEITHGFADSAGVKIHYASAGEGPLVVMIHGFPDFWYTWRVQMPALVKAGYKVVAIDQRGFNRSDQPEKVEDYAIPKLVDDVVAVIRHHNVEKAIIVGHDWGGFVAWSFAMMHPERTDRLVVLNCPHPRGIGRELATNPAQRAASAYARGFQKPGAGKLMKLLDLSAWVKDADARSYYKKAFERSSLEGMLNYYKANYPREPYIEPKDSDYPPVQCSTLLMHGLADTALLPGGLNDTWKWINADLTLVTIPGAGHFVQQDAADQVSQTIVRWLDQ